MCQVVVHQRSETIENLQPSAQKWSQSLMTGGVLWEMVAYKRL